MVQLVLNENLTICGLIVTFNKVYTFCVKTSEINYEHNNSSYWMKENGIFKLVCGTKEYYDMVL